MKDLLKKFFEGMGLFTDFRVPTEPDEEVGDGERVIADMNDLEKGIYSFICAQGIAHTSVLEQIEEAKKRRDINLLKDLSQIHKVNHNVTDLARKIMWTSIENRIVTSSESKGVGIRKGYKIVETFEDDDESSLFSDIAIPIGMIISMSRRS